MTYVDGYNSFSGEVNIPIIPENMLSLMANGFYQRINTKGFQIDFRKNKKEIIIEKKNPKVTEADVIISKSMETPDDQSRSIPNLFNRTQVDKPSIDEDEKSENDSSSEEIKEFGNKEESYYEEEVKAPPSPPPKKKPIEKTWERYEKKATYQKKGRDQCGPGDCQAF